MQTFFPCARILSALRLQSAARHVSYKARAPSANTPPDKQSFRLPLAPAVPESGRRPIPISLPANPQAAEYNLPETLPESFPQAFDMCKAKERDVPESASNERHRKPATARPHTSPPPYPRDSRAPKQRSLFSQAAQHC